MADGSSKPSIPAWQQRAQPTQPTSPEVNDSQEKQAPIAKESTAGKQDEASSDTSVEVMNEEESAPPSEGTSQLDMVEAFLADPDVKTAPLEKKRAFLESKEIPVETIDQVLKPESVAFQPGDVDAFKQRQQQPAPKPSPLPSQRPTGPPIITYPEYLVEAHNPPPLITPGRILGAAYIAGGLATLIYGASKYIVTPMIDGMTEARHDFATHSQSKLDDFNDRLSKIVSKVPEPRKDLLDPDMDVSEVDSVTSDPTELYHRDMGTQTSPDPPPHTNNKNLATASTSPLVKKDALTHQTTGLSILKSHLSELLLAADKQEATNKERQDSINKLRHYLDTVMYGSPNITAWSTSEEAMTGKPGAAKGKEGREDGVEALKREIRGVKGVLLSARRFPAAGGGVGRAGVGV
ncbi:hypothetical protein LTR36_010519 [Oleoguttula mirabilis]|uniref:Peroxisome membrane anchor protein Pex14p N-terminal domain-containing protein n=1 Tax=Oleoguttula mirabilis TaxID=1507867 RepID=A0AAV9J3W1_9PEZI|nr:hypothetical protein LTR36_010519 [Oleoguttula mirabilis]